MNYKVPCIYGKIANKSAQVAVPGSKSITARALLLATLAKGESTLFNVQFSDDCAAFLRCVEALGIKCSVSGTTVKIEGCGGVLPVKNAELFVGSAGTAARFLTALLAFSEGTFKIDGSEQMAKRPMAPLKEALVSAGADLRQVGENSLPMIICGTREPKSPINIDITASSQFLSALLISAVCAKYPVTIKPLGAHGREYINMTLDMMWSFGVNAEEKDGCFTVSGGYSAKRYEIEPDLSAASYFYAANRILGTEISVKGVMPHSMQGDGKFIKLIKDFNGGKIDMSSFSDQALTLAAVAPYFDNPTEICGVAHIRKQECDRIAAIVHNLTAMGVKAEEREDGVKIYPSQPKPAKIDAFGDHRVAMAFALTGLRAEGIEIENAQVCSKTFKEYFEVLDGVISALTWKK